MKRFLTKRSFATQKTFNTIKLTKQSNGVALLELYRPKALNALNSEIVKEIHEAIVDIESDKNVRATVITGSEKAFAAGADIKEMMGMDFMDVYKEQLFKDLDALENIARKPVIAAVNGYALGGGCELAMMADMIIAGESAVFGQPEITIGTIPGIGGTQRLTQLVGKGNAMELVLTGDLIKADRAMEIGLVNKVVADPVEEAQKIAEKIAQKSQPIVMLAKECIKKSLEVGLHEGLAFEQKVFQSTFSTHDRKHGMETFSKKEKPVWQDK